jgi:hypothetical protein
MTGELDGAGVDVPMPDNFGDSLQAFVTAETDRGSPQFASTGFLRRFAAAPTVAFDFATALPRFTDGNLTMNTPKRPELTWTTAAPLTATDGGFLVVNWTIDVLGDSFTSGNWTFVVPPGTSSVTAPELPADATYAPTPDHGGPDLRHIVFIESDAVPDYATLKKLPVGTGGAAAMLSSFRPLPQPGTVRLTALREDLDSLVRPNGIE